MVFALVVLVTVAAALSPLVVAGALVALARPRSRALGRRLLGWGGAAFGIAAAANVVIDVTWGDPRSPASVTGTAILGGAALTLVAIAILGREGWRARRARRAAV